MRMMSKDNNKSLVTRVTDKQTRDVFTHSPWLRAQ